MCIENNGTSNGISIPRGKKRAFLEEKGLIAKLYISNEWPAGRISSEITDLFRSCFEPFEGPLQFHYLKTLTGTKMLRKQKVSKDFPWDARAVLNLARLVINIVVSCDHKLITPKSEDMKVVEDQEATHDADMLLSQGKITINEALPTPYM